MFETNELNYNNLTYLSQYAAVDRGVSSDNIYFTTGYPDVRDYGRVNYNFNIPQSNYYVILKN